MGVRIARPQATAFLESSHYPDNGCQFHPACLECPEPVCILEAGQSWRRRMARRQEEARLLRQQGLKIREIAARLGCSRRAVYGRLAADRGD